MRIIHTADIHLDRSFADLSLPPSQGSACRAHLAHTLRTILTRAATWPADALVITGDLFEHGRVTRSTVKKLRDMLKDLAPVKVFICPGRHDPLVSGSPYLTEQWPENVYIFSEQAWSSIELPGTSVTIHGFAWKSEGHDGSLPEPLELPENGRTHLAFGYGLADSVLHGAPLEPAQLSGPLNLPAGLAFLGLGELHATRNVEGQGDTQVWYAGAPEAHVFSGHGPHYYLEIEVAQDGAVSVSPKEVSEGRFLSLSLDCSDLETGQELIDKVRESLGNRSNEVYLRLSLEGQMPRPVYGEMEGIRDVLADAVAYLQWRDSCQVAEDYDTIATEPTSLGGFVARINAEIQDAPSHALRQQRLRSRDLGLCAYRGAELPIRGLTGAQR